MRKKSIILAVLAVAVLGGLCWLVLRPSEPVYKGKQLSYWLKAYANGDPRITLEDAASAIRSAGTNAIPTLLRMLRANDSALKLKLVALSRKQHIINIRFDAAETQNRAAFLAFSELVNNAWSAVPGLIEIYERNISPESQRLVACTLRDIGPPAKKAVPVFARAATRGDWYYSRRIYAIDALGGIHSEPEMSLPALITCLQDSNVSIAETSANALGDFGKDAKPAIPALSALAQNPDPAFSVLARLAIERIDPDVAAKLPAISVDAVK